MTKDKTFIVFSFTMKIRIGGLAKNIFLTYIPDSYGQILREIVKIDETYPSYIRDKIEEILATYSQKDPKIKKLINDYDVKLKVDKDFDKPIKARGSHRKPKYSLQLLKKSK
jgi:hypothetical protein